MRSDTRLTLQEGKARLDALRRRGGSPGAIVDPTAGLSTNEIIAKHRREREREERTERRERKARDRLDFDFPSASKKSREAEHRGVRVSEDESSFQSGGHINFWADHEAVRS